jgi:alpha-L-rhamnosidase
MTARIRRLSVEHHREPFGIGEARPRISWQVETDEEGWAQTAYEIEVAAPSAAPSAAPFSTGRIDSPDSLLVAWPATPLSSRDRRSIRVRVWGTSTARASDPSPWSDPLEIEAGLLSSTDWSAQLIAPGRQLGDRLDRPPVLVRRAFDLGLDRGPDADAGPVRRIASARLYVTAHGHYVAEINGHRIGNDVFTPGWTSYHHRLRYQIYDVTALLLPGRNVIGATLAEGWYAGHLGFHGGKRRIWGDDVAFLAQLEIRFVDGTAQTVTTDADWQWADGPRTGAGIYAGETYDARLERPGWSAPDGRTERSTEEGWQPVVVVGRESSHLVAPGGPPVRRTQELAPVAIVRSPSGRTIVDFGQNLVGRVRLRVNGPAATAITLTHAEVLEGGEVATRPLRGAAAVDRYVCAGRGTEEWEPDFTYHGFRYVDVEGWLGEVGVDDLRAVVLHTDMERTGWFECSNELLSRFHENVVWTMRGNFMDVPTDCPQRDERLGWTGDASVFAPAATFLYDCSGMLREWLKDVAVEHSALGTVPAYVPWFPLSFPLAPIAVWGDAAVTMPWILYERFGDVTILREQFRSMSSWVDEIARVSEPYYLWQTGLQLGDWLDPTAPADAPERARTDPHLIATAYHAWTAALVARAARVLGREEDATRFERLARDVKAAFDREYVTASGRLVCDAPTAFAIALGFELLPNEAAVRRARRRLLELVAADGYHAGTGFVGGRVICDALAAADGPASAGDSGLDAAYHLLTQMECPSWLFPVTMGATTVWERWDSMLPDGSLNPGDMLSFNHYALASVADFLHRVVAGIAPEEPGYRRIRFEPRPGGGLTHARAAHETPFGRAEIAWRRERERLIVDVIVPPGSHATVSLPGVADVEVGSGHHHFACPYRDAAADPPIPKGPASLGLPPETASGQFEG